jgi:predicted membrane protein
MNQPRNQSQVLLGAFVLILGALFLLDNLRIFSTRDIIAFWPMVFVAVGGLKLYQSHASNNRAGYVIGGVFVLVGLLMTLHQAGVIYFRLRDWWPAILIAVGAFLLWRGLAERDTAARTAATQGAAEGSLNAIAFMSGNKQRLAAVQFRGAEATAIMGGVELDLRLAQLEGEARINVFTFWGGIEIKVPQDWCVVLNGMPLLGAIEDKTLPPMNTAKQLIIEGYAIMGGVEVKN